jgi:FAD binding domain
MPLLPPNGTTTDVLVVGGGPVGSALAIELSMRGVDCVLVEQRDVSVPERGNIRARGVSMLSMEHLRRATISDLSGGANVVVEAAFVVGCEGPHSLVRQVAGITRTESVPLGQNLGVSLYFPHAFDQLGIEPSANFTIFDGTMNTLFCPYQEDEWGYAIGPVPVDFDLSGLDLATETRRRIGRDASFELLWSSPYPIQQRVADTYRAGRLFIAGDAAHLFPPYLGQNMNTGLDDAGVVLDQRYRSSVIAADGSLPPIYDGARYQPYAKPGHRAPHFYLDTGSPLLDALGPGLTLLDFGAHEGGYEGLTKATADVGAPLKVVPVREPRASALYDKKLVLVRCDQHVAWRGDAQPADPRALIDQVRGAA